MTKICILTIATNKYLQFVEELYNDISEKFCPGSEINCLLFTDHEIEECGDNVKVHYIEHEPWPIPTLKRYNYFVKEKDFILSHDYCYYFDVDMRIISEVKSEEIFSDGVVATMHPWQSFYPKEQRSFDRNPDCSAYVAEGDEPEFYYAGGFNGGKTEKFIEMAEVIADRVTKDLEKGVIAKWHDESHLNRYLIDNPATLTLTPNYCFDEQFLNREVYLEQDKPYPYTDPKIVALKKNHKELRK